MYKGGDLRNIWEKSIVFSKTWREEHVCRNWNSVQLKVKCGVRREMSLLSSHALGICYGPSTCQTHGGYCRGKKANSLFSEILLLLLLLATPHGLQDLSSLTRDWTQGHGSESAWSPNHWIARELPEYYFLERTDDKQIQNQVNINNQGKFCEWKETLVKW